MAIRWARSTFLAVIGKEGAGLHRGVVGDDHVPPAGDRADAVRPRRPPARRPTRRTSRQPAHRPSSKKRRARIEQLRDPLAGRQPAFGVLPLDGRRAAAQANLLFLADAVPPAGQARSRAGRHGRACGFRRSQTENSVVSVWEKDALRAGACTTFPVGLFVLKFRRNCTLRRPTANPANHGTAVAFIACPITPR